MGASHSHGQLKTQGAVARVPIQHARFVLVMAMLFVTLFALLGVLLQEGADMSSSLDPPRHQLEIRIETTHAYNSVHQSQRSFEAHEKHVSKHNFGLHLPQHDSHALENSASLLESVANIVHQHVRASPWKLDDMFKGHVFGHNHLVPLLLSKLRAPGTGSEAERQQALAQLLAQQPLPLIVQQHLLALRNSSSRSQSRADWMGEDDSNAGNPVSLPSSNVSLPGTAQLLDSMQDDPLVGEAIQLAAQQLLTGVLTRAELHASINYQGTNFTTNGSTSVQQQHKPGGDLPATLQGFEAHGSHSGTMGHAPGPAELAAVPTAAEGPAANATGRDVALAADVHAEQATHRSGKAEVAAPIGGSIEAPLQEYNTGQGPAGSAAASHRRRLLQQAMAVDTDARGTAAQAGIASEVVMQGQQPAVVQQQGDTMAASAVDKGVANAGQQPEIAAAARVAGSAEGQGSAASVVNVATVAEARVVPRAFKGKRIPRIIHQIYFPGKEQYLASAAKPNAFMQTNWQHTCRIHHPRWKYIFWNISMAEALIRRRVPSFLPIFRAYPTDMYRSDAFRYIVLKEIGGLYLDLDVECWRAGDAFLAGSQLVLQGHGTLEPLANGMIATVPGHPLWDRVMDKLVQFAQRPASFMEGDARRILYVTGPQMFSGTVMEMLGVVEISKLFGKHVSPEYGSITIYPLSQWYIPCQLFNETCFEQVEAARGMGMQPLAMLAGHHRYSRAWDSLKPKVLRLKAQWEDGG